MADGYAFAPPERPLRVVGLGGSLSPTSKSLIVLEAALRLAAGAGAETALHDVRELDLPVYDPSRHPADPLPGMARMLAAVRAADAVLVCSPTYHGTISGAVKNALDALDALDALGEDTPSYLTGKVAALLALGGGGATNVLNALGHAVRAMDAQIVPRVVAVPVGAVDVDAREIGDRAVRERLAGQIAQVLTLARRLRLPSPEPVAAR